MKTSVLLVAMVGLAATDALTAEESWQELLREIESEGAAQESIDRGIALLSAAETNENIKWQLALALSRHGPLARPAISPTIELLSSKDDWVRGQSASALANFGPFATSAVPELIKMMEEDLASINWHATIALGEIGDERAIGRLLSYVRTRSNPDEWNHAATALGSFSTPVLSRYAEVKKTVDVSLLGPAKRYVSAYDPFMVRIVIDFYGRLVVDDVSYHAFFKSYVSEWTEFTFVLTDPHGNVSRLRVHNPNNSPSIESPIRLQNGTYMDLSENGIRRDLPWIEGHRADFSTEGSYSLWVEGEFVDLNGIESPVPFRTKSIDIQVSRDFAPEQELVREALDRLSEIVDASLNDLTVFSNELGGGERRVVRILVSPLAWPEDLIAEDQREPGTYRGAVFAFVFDLDGTFVDSQKKPVYRRVD